jgi:hypothetical protein
VILLVSLPNQATSPDHAKTELPRGLSLSRETTACPSLLATRPQRYGPLPWLESPFLATALGHCKADSETLALTTAAQGRGLCRTMEPWPCAPRSMGQDRTARTRFQGLGPARQAWPTCHCTSLQDVRSRCLLPPHHLTPVLAVARLLMGARPPLKLCSLLCLWHVVCFVFTPKPLRGCGTVASFPLLGLALEGNTLLALKATIRLEPALVPLTSRVASTRGPCGVGLENELPPVVKVCTVVLFAEQVGTPFSRYTTAKKPRC